MTWAHFLIVKGAEHGMLAVTPPPLATARSGVERRALGGVQ